MTKDESSGSVESDWAKLANYGSGFEADLVRATLEEADIVVQVRGHQIGMYGPGFLGPVIGGVDLYVPSTELERARELLEE